MVPGEVFDHALAGGVAHFFDNIRVTIECSIAAAIALTSPVLTMIPSIPLRMTSPVLRGL